MAKKTSILDELITLPWWFNLILAAMTYVFLKYWLPTVEFKLPAIQSMIMAFSNMAGMFSSVLIAVAGVSALHFWRKGELIERQVSVNSVQRLSWKEFEYLVSEAYRRKGFAVSENTGSGPDGGIDLVLVKDAEKILVLCKNWKSRKVGVPTIRELFGVVVAEGASKGIVVCSGSFTAEAIEFARKNNIELVGGNSLARIISTVQKKQPIQAKSNTTSTSCPLCGSHMVNRVAKRSRHVGKSFLGCSTFPKCRGTRS